jgi:hypothetical protein
MLLREVLNLISFFFSQSGPEMPAPYVPILLNKKALPLPFIHGLQNHPLNKWPR